MPLELYDLAIDSWYQVGLQNVGLVALSYCTGKYLPAEA